MLILEAVPRSTWWNNKQDSSGRGCTTSSMLCLLPRGLLEYLFVFMVEKKGSNGLGPSLYTGEDHLLLIPTRRSQRTPIIECTLQISSRVVNIKRSSPRGMFAQALGKFVPGQGWFFPLASRDYRKWFTKQLNSLDAHYSCSWSPPQKKSKIYPMSV